MTILVAIITGGSQGIGAGLVASYRGWDWAVVASASADSEIFPAARAEIASAPPGDPLVAMAGEQFAQVEPGGGEDVESKP